MSTYFKKFLKKTYFYNYYLERKLKGKYLFKSVTVMNFIFQRLFRINSSVNFSIHYTSIVVSPENFFTESYFSLTVSSGVYIQAKNYVFIGITLKLLCAHTLKKDADKQRRKLGKIKNYSKLKHSFYP